MSSVAQVLHMSDEDVTNTVSADRNYWIIVEIDLFHCARNKWSPQGVTLTAIMCVIWALATVFMGISWHGMVSTYVTHGQSRDSSQAYIQAYGDENWSMKRRILTAVSKTAVALNAILAELINIWRCWELYHRNWLVAGLPLLCVLCGLISHLINMVVAYSTAHPTFVSPSQVTWSIVYYTITAFTNILTTSLIIFRILSVGGLASARTYHGLLEILVESAFLYSATYIVYLVLFVENCYASHWSYTNWYVQGLLNAVTALAPTMIIGRVMSGGARPND
ncbi:hypothetical protein CPB85DRAFT_1440569 [Mucidula mucida]|nr:hypothetical protein CPB85DRAFT_1440569 [Mucidula mucida]